MLSGGRMKNISLTKRDLGLSISCCLLLGAQNLSVQAQSGMASSQALGATTPVRQIAPGTVRNTTNNVVQTTPNSIKAQTMQSNAGVPSSTPIDVTGGESKSAKLTGSALQIDEAEKVIPLSAEQMQKAEASIVGKYKGSWQMFMQNPCHTGVYDLTSLPTGKMHWTFPAEGPIDSSPAVVHGVVYVGSDDGNVYAVDERNGSMLWHTRLGDKVKSSPAVVDGVLYVGCEDKNLYALDARSGKMLWTFPTQDRVSSSPVVMDGVVFVGSWDGFLYAVDCKTGVQKWKFQTGMTDSRITSAPSIAPDVVLVASHNGSLFCLNSSNGALRWQFKTGGKIFATPLVMGSLVYFGSWDKKFYAVDLATGVKKWKYD
jgi:outer membrane protein assembly factor BamB